MSKPKKRQISGSVTLNKLSSGFGSTATAIDDLVVNEKFIVDNMIIYVDNNNQRVGINTKTPSASLHVIGDVIVSGTITSSGGGGSSTSITLGTVGTTPNSNAATLINNVLRLQPADATNAGLLSITSQTIAGNKLFTGSITASNFSGSSSGTNTGDVSVTSPSVSSSSNGIILTDQTLQLTPADSSNPGIITTSSQTFAGNKIFTGSISASNFSGSSSGTNTGDITIGAPPAFSSSTGMTLTGQALQLNPADATNPGIVTTGTQSFSGDKTVSGTLAATNLSGTNTGDVTVTTVGSSPNSNAITISGQQLQLQPADGSNPGIITTGTQTISGDKTVSGTLAATNLSGTNTGDVTVTTIGVTPNANGVTVSRQQLQLQPADASFGGIITTTTQSIAGNKTFTGDLIMNKSINYGTTTTSGTTVTLDDTAYLWEFSATSAVTVTIPTAVSSVGRSYILIKTSINGSVVTINTSGSDTIDDGLTTTLSLINQYDKIKLISNGVAMWYSSIN